MRTALSFAALVSSAFLLAGCVTGSNEVVRFTPGSPQQQAMLRDGQSVITSRGRASVVTLRPATRQVENGRPVFIVEIQNLSKKPVTFTIAGVSAQQTLGTETHDLKVFSYDELVQEEKNAQTGRAIAVALVGGLNAASAGNNYWRQAHASDENAAMAANVAATGERNLAALETMAIKDDTLLPGETYGGRLVVQGPDGDAPTRSYTLVVQFGPDVHQFLIAQGAAI